MMGARDLADKMAARGEGYILNQFANLDNPEAHYRTTGPEIWQQTEGSITHFVSAMGTTGTIMGCSRYFGEMNPDIQIIGVQPEDGSTITGIRRWPPEYVPDIFDSKNLHRIIDVNQREAEEHTRQLARDEGIFCGTSSGGALAATLKLAAEIENAHIVSIVCDRGDRYLSTDLFSAN